MQDSRLVEHYDGYADAKVRMYTVIPKTDILSSTVFEPKHTGLFFL